MFSCEYDSKNYLILVYKIINAPNTECDTQIEFALIKENAFAFVSGSN